MARLLVAGDSFFCNDPKYYPGEHFSDMFGTDVEVVNVAGPGLSNTGIIGKMLYALAEQSYDYVVIGFTIHSRLPIVGETAHTADKNLIQWKTTSNIDSCSNKEIEIIDSFMSISGDEETMTNSLMVIDLAMRILTERKIKFAWAWGGMYEVTKLFATTISGSDPRKQLFKSIKKFKSQALAMDYWSYPTIKKDPVWHIDDVKYQEKMAGEFKKILGIEL